MGTSAKGEKGRDAMNNAVERKGTPEERLHRFDRLDRFSLNTRELLPNLNSFHFVSLNTIGFPADL
jgi:hypothetical protein